MLTLLTGGARSGKSALAVEAGKRCGGHVSVIATGEPGDDEMAARIQAHRDERPWDWSVIEEPVDIVSALEKFDDESLVLVDCLTLWVANMMGRGASEREIEEVAGRAAHVAAGRVGSTIVVTNEVGSGIVPIDAGVRAYRDVLGRVNRIFATAADRSFLVVSGKLLRLQPAEELVLS